MGFPLNTVQEQYLVLWHRRMLILEERVSRGSISELSVRRVMISIRTRTQGLSVCPSLAHLMVIMLIEVPGMAFSSISSTGKPTYFENLMSNKAIGTSYFGFHLARHQVSGSSVSIGASHFSLLHCPLPPNCSSHCYLHGAKANKV
jgi:hypothetical protein